MPLYEYACTRCGERRELLVRSSSEGGELPLCPACGEPMGKEWAPVACHTKTAGGACGGGGRGGFS